MSAFFPFWTRISRDGRLYAVLSAAGFALKAIFVKLGYAAGAQDAISLLALRMGFALPLFLLLWVMSREPGQVRLTLADCGRVWILALLGYYLSSLFDFYGLQTISSNLERVILYVYPTLVLVFQALLLRRWPQRTTVQAMLICYAGLLIAFIHDLLQSAYGHEVVTGSLWVFASAVTYAMYYIGTGQVVQRIGSMRLTGLAGCASCVLVLLHFVGTGQSATVLQLPAAVWGYGALMALFSTALPVYWMALAIRQLGATQAAAIGSLGPVLTLFASWLMLGEAVSLWQIAGLALVILGVARLKPKQNADVDVAPDSSVVSAVKSVT